MVTIEEIQAAYYMVAATGVLVAAIFYILNLRTQQENLKETTRNRRATFTYNIMQPFTTKEFAKDWLNLLAMRWEDFEDFQKKYDSRVNPNNFALRLSYWNLCDSVGYQYRSGLIDIDTVYNVYGNWISLIWRKFEPVIKEYRKTDFSKGSYENFEYLANAITEMAIQKRGLEEVERFRARYIEQ
jgi:hypothetical protein